MTTTTTSTQAPLITGNDLLRHMRITVDDIKRPAFRIWNSTSEYATVSILPDATGDIVVTLNDGITTTTTDAPTTTTTAGG